MVIVHAYRGRVSAYISALRPTLAPRRGPFFIACGIAACPAIKHLARAKTIVAAFPKSNRAGRF
jgi:hypothetical protein